MEFEEMDDERLEKWLDICKDSVECCCSMTCEQRERWKVLYAKVKEEVRRRTDGNS
jgi:hypothetical protein